MSLIFPDQEIMVISAKVFEKFQKLLHMKNYIYIGKENKFVPGTFNRKWKNPYTVKKYVRTKCLQMFERYINEEVELLNQYDELSGKILVYWCDPEPCHGHVLAKLWYDKMLQNIEL